MDYALFRVGRHSKIVGDEGPAAHNLATGGRRLVCEGPEAAAVGFVRGGAGTLARGR